MLKEYGEQYAATDSLRLTKVEANKEYMKDVKLARIALKGDRELEASMLFRQAGPGKGFVCQCVEYSKSTGRTKEKLNAAQVKVLEVEKKRNMQLKEIGENQAVTEVPGLRHGRPAGLDV